jgi:hypothetical protein
MSKKRNAQHWYQVHKSRAASESENNSKAVAEARERVSELQIEAIQTKFEAAGTVLSGVRRFVFGRNSQEERAYQAESALKEAQSNLNQAVQKARAKGEQAYAADWAARNPDKAK